MFEIRRILCPIDFSEHSRHALDRAAAVARCYGATVTLFHAYSSEPVPAYAPGEPAWPSIALTPQDRDALLDALRRFAENEVGTSLPIEYEIVQGAAATTILERSRSMPSDLLVIGTHGRSGFERLVFGSVAEKVLRKATCPVLSVPRGVEQVVPVPPVAFRRILCATDFSDCASNAFAYARSLSRAGGARLTLLHAIEVPPEMPPDLHETVAAGPRNLSDYMRAVEEYRRGLLRDAVPVDERGTTEMVIGAGRPYREILRVAAEQQSDLVVIGIQGRGAADLMVFGSTAQHVVREATCPVLTLRMA